jgi:hypothetical protein
MNIISWPRIDANERELKIVHDPLPLDSRFLKVNEQGQFDAGCLQVVDALGKVFVSEAIHALR